MAGCRIARNATEAGVNFSPTDFFRFGAFGYSDLGS